MATISKKIFKEKTSIKQELAKALENNTPLTYAALARLVGISLYRVRKYCKSHKIDINDYSVETLNQKIKKAATQTEPNTKKRTRKINLGEPVYNRISLGEPEQIKIHISENP